MAKSPFSQIHTDIKAVISDKGIVNIPGETGVDGRPTRVSFHDEDGTNVALGYYDGKRVHSVEDVQTGLRGKVGIKVRINDIDGDGKISINELLKNARLDGFNYPPVPLIQVVGL